MTLDFFYKNYDLMNLEIKKAYIKNNKLVLNVLTESHLELIANGYRPELDVSHEIEFIFNIQKEDKIYKNPNILEYKYDNGLLININNDSLYILDNEIKVTQIS